MAEAVAQAVAVTAVSARAVVATLATQALEEVSAPLVRFSPVRHGSHNPDKLPDAPDLA